MKRTKRLFLLAVVSGIFTVVLSTFAGAAGAAGAQNTEAANSAPAPSALLPNTASIYDTSVSISYPAGWSVTQAMANTWAIVNVPAGQRETVTPSVQMLIGYLERTDHADAVSQLAEYANESRVPSTFLAIGGWPALQRVQLIDRPQPGEWPLNPDQQMVHITTAVAAGNLLFRLDAGLPSDADQALKDLVLAIGRSLVFSSTGDPAQVQQELNYLKSLPQRPAVLPSAAAPPASALLLPNLLQAAPIFPPTQLPPFFTFANSEPEVAVSSNATNILVAMQGQSFASVDGGKTFSGPQALGTASGDSSVAIGQSGNFYHAALFGGSCPANNNCVEIAALTVTNNAGTAVQTVGTLNNAVVCPNTAVGGVPACFVDQEHIAADRVKAAANNLDNVYVAVRVSAGNGFGPGASLANVACSPDSGAHWSPLFPLEGNSDYPRVTVGSDGFFYVVFSNNGAGSGNIRIDKFNSCPALNTTTAPPTVPAMTRATVTTTVTPFTTFGGCQQANGFGGLDRCNNGNILSSPTIAVDDTKPNHVYVAWAQSNMTGTSENIEVIDSLQGGTDWPNTGRPPVTVNSAVTGKRFMPWVCATGGKAFVTWYDRRAATAANNDLTDYRAASAGLDATNTLVPSNDDFQISTASDPECAQWPFTPRSRYDVLNCKPVVPGIGAGTLVGTCKLNPVPNPDTSSNRACNYSQPDPTACPITPAITQQEVCQSIGGGGPKYGDYAGNACGLGRLQTVFASGVTPSGRTTNLFNSFVVTPTPTTLTYSGPTTGDFDDIVTVSGTLTLSGTSSGVPGQFVVFKVGTDTCGGSTDGNGIASCPILLTQLPGSQPITVSFAGSGNFKATSASGGTFVVTREETLMTPLSQSLISRGGAEQFSARLQDDLPTATPVPGRTINFTLTGSNGASQSCTPSPVTDASGFANCTVSPVTLPLGPATVTASFTGDSVFLPISATQNVFITSPGLPNGWIDQDIGNPGVAGSASFNTGTFSVTGGGADIFDVPDQFHYLYQNGLTGDMSIKAHVETQTETDPLAKAGIMIRETTDPASTFVDVVVTPGDGVKMQARSVTGGGTTQIGRISGVDAPYWVLLVRTGNTFTGFASADNRHWTRLGTVNVTMAPNVNVGMAVTAHDNDDLSTATFDHVLLTTPVYRVNSGDAAAAPFTADQFFSGGATKTTTATIGLDGAPNPAPMAVYRSERFGADASGNDAPFTYTFPNLIPGFQYLVRLHFAEITFTSANRRLFNVTINTTQVLTNFDIVATAGAPNTANVQEFIATADGNGNITITYSHGSANHAKSSGIEIATIH